MVAHVELQQLTGSARSDYLLKRLLRRLVVRYVVDYDVISFRSQAHANRVSDSTASACHQCNSHINSINDVSFFAPTPQI